MSHTVMAQAATYSFEAKIVYRGYHDQEYDMG